ncbi:MAG: inorganic diphosphatase [Pseudomonadota bacterium]
MTLRGATAVPDEVSLIITAPRGEPAFDARLEAGRIVVDRLLHSALRLPGHLGLVEGTLGDDGRPLRGLLRCEHGFSSGTLVGARPIGVLYVSGNDADEVTVLLVPAPRLSPRYDAVQSYTDLPSAELREIAHYFVHYRDIDERQRQRAAGWGDVNEARRAIVEASSRTHRPVG